MTTSDIKFTPHSDMNIDGLDIVNQHQNLISNNQLSDATTLLNNNGYNKGFRASLFNNIQDKIHIIQQFLLNKEDEDSEEVISDVEPTKSDIKFWLVDY